MLDTYGLIRKLSKTDRWQTLFSYAKELNIKLFENDTNLTPIQIIFLKYLSFYNSIYTDIAMGDIDEIVLENEIYEDAYIMYRNKNLHNMKDTPIKKINNKIPDKHSQWIFKSQ